MYKVIVVEDDRIIRRGICQAIPWSENGFVVAGEAGDGEVAIALIEREQPQVVISDINMPFMNGLEMTKLVKEKSPDTRIIFLTGYEEFKYAHEAVKLKAYDYLLKPVDSDVLLMKAIEAAADWENATTKDKKIIESLPFLQQKFFQRLIKEGDHRIDLERELNGLGVRLEGPNFAVLLVHYPIRQVEKAHRFQEKITEITSSFFSEDTFIVMNIERTECAILLSLEDEHDVRKGQLAQKFNHHFNELEKNSVTITFGRTYANLFELGQSFIESRLAMDMKHIMGKGRVFSFDETVTSNEQNENQIHDLELKLENHIKLSLPEKACETLAQLISEIVERKTIHLPDLKIIALKFSTMLFFEMEKWKKEESKSFNSTDIYTNIIKMETLAEMESILQQLIQQWTAVMSMKEEKNRYSHVDEAIKYIKENFHDSSLTLQQVADFIHVSTPYLSNLFKLEKGFNFGDYLLKLRMSKAMESLREGDIKTYEVCDQVGYKNPQYFSICFKKYTGYTPAEYKKQFK